MSLKLGINFISASWVKKRERVLWTLSDRRLLSSSLFSFRMHPCQAQPADTARITDQVNEWMNELHMTAKEWVPDEPRDSCHDTARGLIISTYLRKREDTQAGVPVLVDLITRTSFLPGCFSSLDTKCTGKAIDKASEKPACMSIKQMMWF